MAEQLSSPLPEHVQMAALDGSLSRKERSKARITVRITRFATNSLDPGNLEDSPKALVDSMRDAGLIPNDDQESITLEVNEVKVKHRRHRGVLVELIYP